MWCLPLLARGASRPAVRSAARSLAHATSCPSSSPQQLAGDGLSQLQQQLRWPGAAQTVAQAVTLPSAWYTDSRVLEQEQCSVFYGSWQYACHAGQLPAPGDYLTGELLGCRYIVCKGEDGQLRAFHNVCRHHAAAVAEGSGRCSHFVCPYHGWTYDTLGRLRKATRLKGIQDFKASANGLLEIPLSTWGPFVFLHIGGSRQQGQQQRQPQGPGAAAPQGGAAAWLAEGGRALLQQGLHDAAGLVPVAATQYDIRCNWKVVADNYLDGGYHVPHAHKGLAGGLDLGSYSSQVYEMLSVQRCSTAAGAERDARLAGCDAAYAFIYPNLMINRYGPWMDINLVMPLGHERCRVKFWYFLTPDKAGDQALISSSLQASDVVQREDVALCEAVQRGLESPGYDVGRYAPEAEEPMFAFHRLLYGEVAPAFGLL